MQKLDIIVIGAGVAGLVSALNLAKLGNKVTLIEAKNFIGGRTYSFNDPNSYFDLDNGQHLFAGAYTNFFNFLKQINSYKYLKFQKGIKIKFIDTNRNTYYFNTGLLPGKLGQILGFISFNALNFQQKIKLIALLRKVLNEKNKLSYKSIYNFLIDNKQDKRIISYFWEPLCLAVMNNDLKHSDFEIFQNVLKKLFSGDKDFTRLAYSTVPLSKLYENFEIEFKKAGGKLILGEKLTDVNIENNRVISVSSNRNKFFTDLYIFAVPPYVLNNLFEGKISINLNFEYSTIVSGYIDYDFHYNLPEIIGAIGTNLHWIFNRNKLLNQNSDNRNLSLAITISSANLLNKIKNDDIKLTILKELSLLLNDDRFKNPVFFKLIKDQKATPLLDFESKKMRFNELPELMNAYFVGDWTDTKLPATIEGACQSAISCVNKIQGSNQ